jgi:hypothetical protein
VSSLKIDYAEVVRTITADIGERVAQHYPAGESTEDESWGTGNTPGDLKKTVAQLLDALHWQEMGCLLDGANSNFKWLTSESESLIQRLDEEGDDRLVVPDLEEYNSDVQMADDAMARKIASMQIAGLALVQRAWQAKKGKTASDGDSKHGQIRGDRGARTSSVGRETQN